MSKCLNCREPSDRPLCSPECYREEWQDLDEDTLEKSIAKIYGNDAAKEGYYIDRNR